MGCCQSQDDSNAQALEQANDVGVKLSTVCLSDVAARNRQTSRAEGEKKPASKLLKELRQKQSIGRRHPIGDESVVSYSSKVHTLSRPLGPFAQLQASDNPLPEGSTRNLNLFDTDDDTDMIDSHDDDDSDSIEELFEPGPGFEVIATKGGGTTKGGVLSKGKGMRHDIGVDSRISPFVAANGSPQFGDTDSGKKQFGAMPELPQLPVAAVEEVASASDSDYYGDRVHGGHYCASTKVLSKGRSKSPRPLQRELRHARGLKRAHTLPSGLDVDGLFPKKRGGDSSPVAGGRRVVPASIYTSATSMGGRKAKAVRRTKRRVVKSRTPTPGMRMRPLVSGRKAVPRIEIGYRSDGSTAPLKSSEAIIGRMVKYSKSARDVRSVQAANGLMALISKTAMEARSGEQRAVAKKLRLALSMAPTKMEEEFRALLQMGADSDAIVLLLADTADSILSDESIHRYPHT